ncbi:MAG: hypothetical protein JRI58_02285 [Deltaproteobacteria bacterium]|nr:hypothetical protein [Deltaproteobacteria bacterium]MBW2073567.1 hypothetical protein [Deltaproteobacteria bacterium]RLB82720.1 MAG: hypothetical protein DRH17_04980 [Deltaproteobacteria bacterium]
MEIANTIILVIGLIILGWYQKSRIKILEKHLASQKSILDILKIYLDIFDPQQLQAWVKIRQKTIEKQNDLEIDKMRAWMAGLMQERFETGKWVERETNAAMDLIIRLLFYAPPNVRKKSIAKMPNSMFKDVVKKILDRMPEYGEILAAGGIATASPNSGNEKA